MSFAAVGGIASAVIGAGASIYSSRRASSNASQSAALADPFAANRPRYAQELSNRWSELTSMDPMQMLRDPQFQFLKEQGLGAINSASAAGGSFNSGRRAIEGAKFSTGLASNFLDRYWQQRMGILSSLSTLSGATVGNPGQAGQLYGLGNSASTNYLNQGLGNAMALIGRVPWSNLTGSGNPMGSGGDTNVSNIDREISSPAMPVIGPW